MGAEEAPPAYNTTAAAAPTTVQQPMMQQPMMQQPMMVAQPQQQPANMIGCPSCKQVIGVPPGTPPGSQLSCPACRSVFGLPGAAPMQALFVQQVQPQGQHTVVVVNSDNHRIHQDESEAVMWFWVGCICVICWIICAVKFWNSPSARARSYAHMSLGFFIGLTILWIVVFSIYFSAYSFVYG